MTEWIGIRATGESVTGWRFDGRTRVETLDAAACRDVPGRLPPDRVLVAGADGAPPEPVPARILPEQLLTGPQALVLPGLSQDKPLHRVGAERLDAIGFLAMNPNWDGVICLPGDVTHWIEVSANEALYLHGSLTLRLAGLLSLDGAPDPDAMSETLSRPERLSAALRSAEVARTPAVATGALMGAELAAAKALWLGRQVAVMGTGKGAALYRDALARQGVPVVQADGGRMAEKGMLALGDRFGLTG